VEKTPNKKSKGRLPVALKKAATTIISSKTTVNRITSTIAAHSSDKTEAAAVADITHKQAK